MRVSILAAIVAAALPATAFGQLEVTPVVGFRFGGSLDGAAQATGQASTGLEVADSAAFGVHVAYPAAGGEIELLYSRQSSRLQSSELFAGAPLFELALETWQLGGNALFGDENARLRPFVGIGLGITRLLPAAAGLGNETRFSGSIGGGIKLWLGRHAGFRLEARGFFTLLDTDGGSFCHEGSCELYFRNSQVISQAELRAGLILRF